MKTALPLARVGNRDTALSSAQRQALIGGVPALAPLSPEARAEIAGSLCEERFPSGAVIVREGETGDRCFFLAEGAAEVTTQYGGKALPLAVIRPGELFGELALLSADKTRQATVTATAEVRALTLSAAAFDRIRRLDPAVEAALQQVRSSLEIARFL